MKLPARSHSLVTKTLSSATVIFMLSINNSFVNADELDINKMCERQSILIAAELKNNSAHALTGRDTDMIRLGAMNACRETYKRTMNMSDTAAVTSKKSVTKTELDEKQMDDSVEKESIFDRLLRSEKKEDVNPMQKKHRTGGK